MDPSTTPRDAARPGRRRGANRFAADDFAVLRFAALPVGVLDELAACDEAALDAKIRVLVADADVREALYLASPSLYARLCEWEAGAGAFNGLPQAIARYLLRMASRATPFGTFSCVSACDAGGVRTALALPDRRGMRRLAQLDATVLNRVAQLAAQTPALRPALRYAVNDTALIGPDAVAFIAFARNRHGKRIYRRVELERSVYLDAVVAAAAAPLTIAALVDAVAPQFTGDATAADLDAFAWELVDAQLLCCDQLVDITSADPTRHLLTQLPAGSALHEALARIDAALQSLNGSAAVAPPGAYETVAQTLASLGVGLDRHAAKVDLYTNDERCGALGDDVVAKVERVVDRLVAVTRKRTKLADFARLFTARFGDAEVPLLVVAEELESLGFSDRDASSPALARIVGTRRKHGANAAPPSALDRLIETALAAPAAAYVDITACVDASDAPEPLPGEAGATLVAWLSLWRRGDGDAPVVEVRSVGSQEPGRVMGRFAAGNAAIGRYLMRSAQTADAPVAEIVHLPDDKLGNISSRPVTARYEVRLRGGASGEATRIALDDLVVGVANGRVLVRSRSLGRHLTLRMSNAHAFDRAEALPVYRFLNHVSNQDYDANLVSLRRRLPRARFVPGLTYLGVIVSRPTWLVARADVERLRKTPRAKLRDAFEALRVERGMPHRVALVQADHVIPYDLRNPWMVDDLLRSVLKSDETTLTDVHPDGMMPYLESAAGSHCHELQLALRAGGAARRGAPAPSDFGEAVVPLWDRWVYFNIYTSPHQQVAALAALRPSLDRLVAQGRASGYFFVRYRDDDGAHVRLRVHAPGGGALDAALPALRPAFAALLRDRVVQDVSIATYVRETARYGGDARCAACEEIFCVDSTAVLDALPAFDALALDAWRIAAVAIDSLLRAFGIASFERRLAFAARAARDFATEFAFDSTQRRKIGELYAAGRPLFVDGALDAADAAAAAPFVDATERVANLWKKAESVAPPLSEAALYGVQWSIVHMRLNRLFGRDQRLQEAVVWELLKRSYASVVHRATVAVEAAA